MYQKWMLLYYKQRLGYERLVITIMNLKQTSINVAKRQQSVGIFIIGVSVRITHKTRGGGGEIPGCVRHKGNHHPTPKPRYAARQLP